MTENQPDPSVLNPRRITALVTEQNPDQRRRAAEELAGQDSMPVVIALAGALQDEDKGVRDAAARSLLSLGGENAARALVGYLATTNIITRNLAAELLTTIGEASIPALLPYLKHVDRDVRKFAVDILGLIPNTASLPELIPLLHDSDQNVVVSVVEALGNLGSADALEPLFSVYHEADYTRATVAEALGKIGDPRTSAFLVDQFVREVTAPAPDGVTVYTLAEALAAVGDSQAMFTLGQNLGSVKGKLRGTVLHALVRIAVRLQEPLTWLPEFKSDLLSAMKDEDPAVRVSAATWLVSCADGDVTEAFVRFLGVTPEVDEVLVGSLLVRPDSFVAATRVIPHLEIGGRKAAITLIARLAFEFTRALQSGGRLPDPAEMAEAFDAVASSWHGGDEETRSVIVDALFRLDGDRAIEFLDAILEDPDPWLRMHVIEILALVADRRAPEFIARFLSDEDEAVRDLARAMLEQRGYATEPDTQ